MSNLEVGISERIDDHEDCLRRAIENKLDNLRVSMPGEIVSFDEKNQTATVQPLIKEYVRGEWLLLPQLLDVPCVFPRAGGYCLTFPVKPKDECHIVFNDMCIDAWWQSGGEQTQLEIRRHDLSDATCYLGMTSEPNAVKNYSITSVMLRNEDKDSYFEIVDNDKTINIVGGEKINIKAISDISIETDANINITVSGNITINATGTTTVKSGDALNIFAPIVNIN